MKKLRLFTKKQLDAFLDRTYDGDTMRDYLGVYEDDGCYWVSIDGESRGGKKSRKTATFGVAFGLHTGELLIVYIYVPFLKLYFPLWKDAVAIEADKAAALHVGVSAA